MKKLTPAGLRTAMPSIPDWIRRGQVISKSWTFDDFPAALAFVNKVGRLAESRQHHPDIEIRWNRVTLSLTTHDAGGLTILDLQMAAALDALSPPGPRRRRAS